MPAGPDGMCPAADLFIDRDRIVGHTRITWSYFAEGACEIAEGCVDRPGWRRLLRFGTWTPNQGDADM